MTKGHERDAEDTTTQEAADTAPTDSGDFASMLASYDAGSSVRLQPGAKVRGKVFHISKENVFVAISASQEGVIPRAEMLDDTGRQTVALGDTIEVFVVSTQDGIVLSHKLGRDGGSIDMLEQARDSGMPVEGTVTAVNKGGLEVSIGTHRCFCPMGQVDIAFVEDPQRFMGQTLEFVVKEIKERGRNIVLSRRALLEAARHAKADKLRATLSVGQRLPATVSRIADFGVFVDLGGIDGLIPMSELSHQRVASAADLVDVGDTVEVVVRSMDPDPKRPGQLRISLSLKATQQDPWDAHAAALTIGSMVAGRVVKIESFGAFVELQPGLQGLVHISEMSFKRIRHPSDVVKVDETVDVRVLSVDTQQHRIALSLREGSSDSASSSGAARGPRGSAQPDEAPFDAQQFSAPGKGLGTLGERLKIRR